MLIQNGDHTWLCFKDRRQMRTNDPDFVITQDYENENEIIVFARDDVAEFSGKNAYQKAVCYCDQVIGKLKGK